MKINGWIFFAGIMMVVMGAMTAINGLRAIIDDEHFLYATNPATGSTATVGFDLTAWGWIHLILGIIVVFAAFALLRGAVWARFVAAIIAGTSIIAQIGFIDAQPFWALAIIAIDVAIIYAVATMGKADEEVEIPMQM